MLLKHDVLRAIESGRVEAVYRKWDTARVKTGSRLRTAVGLIEVVSVDRVDQEKLNREDAAAAGFESVPDLIVAAGNRGRLMYRVGVRHAGADPRATLRNTIPGGSELVDIRRRLDRLDAASGHGAWTRETLRLIGDRPEVRAEDLARSLGREKMPFKLDVRKLKELGLTESLERGYRLSPRGQAVLRSLES
ncbi:MAG TPA: hypothetical protein VMS99_07890 [Acidimicrobiia bacterium]|nr:hypothetical protein [Acidimicrobiia bacterium]